MYYHYFKVLISLNILNDFGKMILWKKSLNNL